MSEQVDGMLQIPASHTFEREKLRNYKNSSINSRNFF